MRSSERDDVQAGGGDRLHRHGPRHRRVRRVGGNACRKCRAARPGSCALRRRLRRCGRRRCAQVPACRRVLLAGSRGRLRAVRLRLRRRSPRGRARRSRRPSRRPCRSRRCSAGRSSSARRTQTSSCSRGLLPTASARPARTTRAHAGRCSARRHFAPVHPQRPRLGEASRSRSSTGWRRKATAARSRSTTSCRSNSAAPTTSPTCTRSRVGPGELSRQGQAGEQAA